MLGSMPPLLADFFGDSTDSSTQANDQNFILDNSKSLLHLSSKLLGNIIVSTLQNAINSTSYIKHHRSLKSSLPFLYNQTIRKIDSRGSALLDVEASLMKCLWTVYSLDDERNMKSLIQGFFDTFALLAVKYEFLTTTTTNKRIEDLDISRKTAGGVLLSMEQHRLLKLYFFIDDYLNSESETSSSENKNNASNYTDSSSEYCEAEIHDNLVLKVLLHSTLAFVVDKTSDCDFYMSILKKSTQAVIDTCLTVYVTAPTDVQALTTYGSSTVNSDGSYSGNQSNFELGYENERPTSYFNDMNTSSPSSSSSSSSSLLSSAHVKHSLLNSLLQLQTVINILRYLGVQSDSTNNTSIITGTHVKHTPLPTTTTTKTHSSSSNNNNLSFITTSIHNLQATEIDTQVYWWFSHLARILVPYQPMISLSIKMIVLLVSSSCRFDITTAVLKSSVSKSSPRSNHIASQVLMELLQMNYLNITRVEAIQFLSASPKGTFLIRPHDSNPELYYLSFHSGESEAVKHAIIRKEIITAITPTASGTGTAGAGSIANTTTGALSGKIDSNDATKNRPRLDKSVSVQADEEENKETESGTVIGSATDSQRDSTSGDKVVSKVVFKCGKIGPCDTILDLITSIGKVLPCGLTMTRITDSDLQKQGIKPSAVDATLFQSYSATNADYDYSLNINTNMWQAVFEIFKRFRQQKYTHADGLARLNTMLLTAVVREEEQENEHVYLFFESLLAALTLKELGRFLSDVSVSFSELTSSLEQQWSHFEIASDRLRQIYNDIATYTIKNLATLTSMRTKKEQISIDKRKILYFKDAVVPLSGKEESIVKSLNINSSNINDSKNTKLNDNPLSVPSTSVAVAFEYIYSTTVDFIQALTTISESSLTYQLLKSSHSLLSHHDDDSMSLPIICAEALAVQIFKVLPNNYVRFPGKGCGTFSEHRICCIDSNDLISHLAKTINQYNSKVNSSVLVSINATSVEMSSASASASASNNIKGKSRNNITFDTSGYATSKDDSTIPIQPLNTTNTSSDFIHKGLSSSPSHSNTKHSTVPAKKGLRKALSTTFDEKFKKAHSFIESVVHRVSTTGHLNAHDHSDTSHEISGVNNNSNSRNGEKLHTSSSGIFSSSKGRKTDDDIRDTQLLLQLLLASTPFVRQLFYPRSLPTNADNQDGSNEDHIDLNDGYQLETVQDITLLSPAEYLTWLMEIGTLQSITKSPENAFEGAKLYYRYRDPWEVHVADTSSHISATDFIRYGRNRYKSVVNNCGGNVLAPMIKTFKRYRERALSVTEQLQRRPSLALTPNKPGSTELDEEEEEFKRKLVSLWETLKAESWLVTTISSTSTEDQSVSAVGDVVLGTGVDRVSVSRAHSTGDDAATIDSECSPPRRHLLAANDGIWRSTNGSGDETYLSCLSRHMFRNALFHRLGLPHRFTVSVQVDIFGLKEVGSKDGFSFVHMTSGIELYGILSLGRKRRPNLSQINLVKAPIDGSTVTKPAHAELLKLPSGSHGTEYTWRERTKFKFAFPEELHAHSIHNVKGLDESSLQSGDVWTTNILDPPQMLYLSVYEKTFFADTKLGELSLPMSQLTINRPFRDWVALAGDPSASSTWFVHLQMQLKLPLKVIEQTAPAQAQSLLINKLRTATPSVGTKSVTTSTTTTAATAVETSQINSTKHAQDTTSVSRPVTSSSMKNEAKVSNKNGGSSTAGFLRQMEDSF